MKKLSWWEENLEGVILVIMLSGLTILVMMQVIMRYLFNDPLTWSEELCRLLLVWSGFFSIGYCARKGTTIKLDTVLNALPAKVKRGILILTTVMMIVLLAFLFYGAVKLFRATAQSGSLLPGLLIPQYWLYFGPMVGIGLGCIRFVQTLFRTKLFAEEPVKKED